MAWQFSVRAHRGFAPRARSLAVRTSSSARCSLEQLTTRISGTENAAVAHQSVRRGGEWAGR